MVNNQGHLEEMDILIKDTPQNGSSASPTQHYNYRTPRGDCSLPGENEDEFFNYGEEGDSNIGTPSHRLHQAGHTETGFGSPILVPFPGPSMPTAGPPTGRLNPIDTILDPRKQSSAKAVFTALVGSPHIEDPSHVSLQSTGGVWLSRCFIHRIHGLQRTLTCS